MMTSHLRTPSVDTSTGSTVTSDPRGGYPTNTRTANASSRTPVIRLIHCALA